VEPDPRAGAAHEFAFAPNGDGFLLDARPFQIRSGELHPARIPAGYWRHRIRMVKAMGMNTVSLYVMWNHHETSPGVFDFHTENRDIAAFMRLCQSEGMWVLLRPGPYVCAEWDLGGIPSYLLGDPDIELRTDSGNDARYMPAVIRYIAALVPLVEPLMARNGGPVLMIQIENEFGSYASNPAYLEEIRQAWLGGGIEGPFYTEDGLTQLLANRTSVEGGAIALSNGDAAQIAAVRQAFPAVPAMAGEVYPGWLTHWGDAALQGTAVDISDALDALMRQHLSFSLYVIHGGTSFGFSAGANLDPGSGEYQPDITSYDYAAPISEQGVATPKYMKYRGIVARYLKTPLPEVPTPVPTIARTGREALVPECFACVWDNLPAALVFGRVGNPPSFEACGQSSGFMLYRTTLGDQRGGALHLGAVHDYATVFADGQYVGGVSRMRLPQRCAQPLGVVHDAPLVVPPGLSTRGGGITLDILVEGMGRVNYGRPMIDRKGLPGPVTLRDADGASETLTQWQVFMLPMHPAFIANLRGMGPDSRKAGLFFRAGMTLDALGDTYLDMSNWTKGVVWVNGHNLGRYWNIGPQTRLYCPATWLARGENVVTIFDLHQTEAQPIELAHTLS
jgi:beta-galactosidase